MNTISGWAIDGGDPIPIIDEPNDSTYLDIG